jgi:hypothetical protein
MRQILTLFFVVFIPLRGWGETQPEKSDGLPFKVEISISKDSLKADFYKKIGAFFVDTKIKNLSNRNQDIIIWTQQGWSWISDNPDVFPGTEALQNIPVHITLKPDEEYIGRVETFTNHRKAKSITFRLGFFPKAERPVSGQPDMQKSNEIIWSNSVELSQ